MKLFFPDIDRIKKRAAKAAQESGGDPELRSMEAADRACLARLREMMPELAPKMALRVVSGADRERDRAIHRACFRRGGLAFYTRLLITYLDGLPEQTPGAQALWIGAYNSAVSHIEEQYEELRRELDRIRLETDRALSRGWDEGRILRALGYEDPGEAFRELGRLRASGAGGREYEAQKRLAALRCEKNREALRRAERLRAGDAEPRSSGGLRLLDRLEESLRPGEGRPPGDYVSRDPEEYRRALSEYAGRLSWLLDEGCADGLDTGGTET